ncbi:MAG: hypothetical protein ACE5I9_07980 [Candidatus Methylomirabilales bacterium]
MAQIRARLLDAKDDVMLWGWRSPGRRVVLTLLIASLMTLLIFLGQMVGSWLGGWVGELGAALGMLLGGWIGLLAGTLIAEAVGVSFHHRCCL